MKIFKRQALENVSETRLNLPSTLKNTLDYSFPCMWYDHLGCCQYIFKCKKSTSLLKSKDEKAFKTKDLRKVRLLSEVVSCCCAPPQARCQGKFSNCSWDFSQMLTWSDSLGYTAQSSLCWSSDAVIHVTFHHCFFLTLK